MNYYYDPAVAAEVAAWVNYMCPVAGSPGGAREERPGARRQPVHLPERGHIAEHNIQGFRALTPEETSTQRPLAKVIGN